MGVVFYNGAYQVATTTSFGNQDAWWLDNDHEGFNLDPDVLRDPDCIYSWFEHNILPLIQQDPKFIAAGIAGATASQRKTLHKNLVKHAKIYRVLNRKPDQIQIDAAAAERAARDDVLAQLEEGKDALLDLKNNHEGKIKQMKNDRKSKEADYKELQDQLRTLENEHGITQGKLRVTTENLQETKSEMKEKEYEITALKGEVDNKQSPGKKMQSKINDKLLATGNVTGAMQWFEKNKEHNIREKKLGLLGAQGISTTGAIAGNAKGDGNHTSESLLATYNQLTLGINATDTVPKEQYDNDIKRLQQKCTDSDNKCTGERAEKLIWESKYNNSDQKNKELKEKLTVVKQECEKWKGDTGKFERALADETAKFEGVKDVLSRVRGMRKDDEDRYQALLEEYLKLKNRSL
mmetsp:Transcript_30217/g.34290  ORF Transcript_30217/g.34290 Transcript_30217/m.34290 type:complete len:407 (+) Transcript_30217:65-1285(+)